MAATRNLHLYPPIYGMLQQNNFQWIKTNSSSTEKRRQKFSVVFDRLITERELLATHESTTQTQQQLDTNTTTVGHKHNNSWTQTLQQLDTNTTTVWEHTNTTVWEHTNISLAKAVDAPGGHFRGQRKHKLGRQLMGPRNYRKQLSQFTKRKKLRQTNNQLQIIEKLCNYATQFML